MSDTPQSYGGNLVRFLSDAPSKNIEFCANPYTYSFVTGQVGRELSFDRLKSYCIYVYEIDKGVQVSFSPDSGQGEQPIELGDAVVVELAALKISLKGTSGGAKFLLAGIDVACAKKASCVLIRAANLKRVTKPWGHELWINGEHPGYVIKQIFIRAGNRTSLQYHVKKRETIVLTSGEANLHYRKNPNVGIDSVTPEDLTSVRLKPFSMVDVFPNTLHRMESVIDMMLYEVSTPQLDDVVRVSDDSNRKSGRLDSEHRS